MDGLVFVLLAGVILLLLDRPRPRVHLIDSFDTPAPIPVASADAVFTDFDD